MTQPIKAGKHSDDCERCYWKGRAVTAEAKVAELRSEIEQHLAYIKHEGEAFARYRDEWIESTEAAVRQVLRVRVALDDHRNHADWCNLVGHKDCCWGECDCHIATIRAALDGDA